MKAPVHRAAARGAIRRQRSLFISHDHRDRLIASAVARLVSNTTGGRWKCFLSSEPPAIPYGHDWRETVMRSIRAADFVIVIMTPRSRLRAWVLYEAGVATAFAKRIAQLDLDKPAIDHGDGPLRHLQHVDGSEDAITQWLEELRQMVADPPQYDHEFLLKAIRSCLDDIRIAFAQIAESDSETAIDQSVKALQDIEGQLRATTQYAERLAGIKDGYRWSHRVLEYAQAASPSLNRLTAAVRHWEIDPNWLLFGDDGSGPPADSYAAFVALAQLNQQNPRLYGRFVCQGPIRMNYWRPDAAQSMRFFFGLIYTLCLIYRARQVSIDAFGTGGRRPVPARIRIGYAPMWVHVINDEVYQVIEGPHPATALSRPLHENLPKAHDVTRHAVATAYDQSLRGYYNRAVRAEAWVASMILATERPHRQPSERERERQADLLTPALLSRTHRIQDLSTIDSALELMGSSSVQFASLLFRECLAFGVNEAQLEARWVQGLSNWRISCHNRVCGAVKEYLRLRARFIGASESDMAQDCYGFLLDEAML